ncbi:MAG: flagellar hook-associated protein FlgK [Gammaproteobacteria bacterium]|nr:flagellar hook-associated protein FlgK [Gammaproteobacteria bacterium]
MGELLTIGTSGLLAAQKSLDTIANNIANASTPGYNRQVTILDTLPSTRMGNFYSGSGVHVTGTERIVNDFVVQSLRLQQSNLSESQSYNDVIKQIDLILADPSLGITDGLNNIFNSLQEVTNDPGSIPGRQIFLTQNEILENRLNELNTLITNQFAVTNAQIVEDVTTINNLAHQIADINFRIQNLGITNFAAAPNDLLDQREDLLLTLSKYVGISTSAQDNGALNIFIGNGQSLVIGEHVTNLSTKPNPLDAIKTDIVISNGSFSQDITNSFSGGDIGGLISVRDTIIPQALNAIGRIAISIAMTFNEQHTQGIDLNGNLGTNMFNDPNDYTARTGRAIQNRNNSGNAVIGVSINPINPEPDISTVYSSASNIVDAGTLPPLGVGILNINGFTIRPTIASDDTVSTSDALSSAIAISKAINSQSTSHLVTAIPQSTVAYLGTFTPGALAAGNLRINGVDIISTGINETIILQDINAVSSLTGVTAVGDGNMNITLVASDGRNIQLTKTVNSAASSFTYFDMNAGPALDKVIKASIKLVSQQPSSIVIGGISPSSEGFTAGSFPTIYTSLTTYDYQLSYDGALYTLRRVPDYTLVAQSASPNFSVDGFTLNIESGTFVAGDSFFIQPTRTGARDFRFELSDPLTLAMGLPVKVDASLSNKGSAQITVMEITDTSGVPLGSSTVLGNAFSKAGELTPPIRIEFISPTQYVVYDISQGIPGNQLGPIQQYNPTNRKNNIFPISGVVDKTLPGPNPTYIYDPGYRISINGVAQIGDVFTIGFNEDATGDNRNGLLITNLQFSKSMVNKSATFQDAYSQFVGSMGGQASQAQINMDSRAGILHAIEARRNEISGVNIDEEAANLLKFEQAYQATAQIIVIARGVFDSILKAIGG